MRKLFLKNVKKVTKRLNCNYLKLINISFLVGFSRQQPDDLFSCIRISLKINKNCKNKCLKIF